MLKGIYIVRNDLCALEVIEDAGGVSLSWCSTQFRSKATRFPTVMAAFKIIEEHELVNCCIVEFPS